MATDTPAYVQERAQDYALVERETGAVLSAHDSLRGALDAALGLDAFGRKLTATKRARKPMLHDAKTKEPNGEYRWLDSTAEELTPADDGSQVTAGRIRSMAANLDATGDAIPLDGGVIAGLAPSDVHGQLFDTGTLARGWAHVGAEWRESAESAGPDWPNGRVHLAFYAELLPPVARALDTGELALGSIGFRHGKGDEAEAIQYALTNRPIVKGLLSAGAMRSEPSTELAHGATRRVSMTDKTKTGARGAATEKFNAILASIGVSSDDAMKDFYDKVHRPLCLLADAAAVEKILEGSGAEVAAAAAEPAGEARATALVGLAQRTGVTMIVTGRATLASDLDKRITAFAKDLGVDVAIVKKAVLSAMAAQMGASDEPAAEAETTAGKADDAAVTPRAVEGLEGPALDAFATDVVAVLRAIFGDDAMAPAALLDALKAAQDGIKGMLAGGAGAPAEGAPGDANAPAGRAVDVASRAELTAVRAQLANNATTIATLEAKVGRSDLTVETARAFTAAGRIANEKAITEAVDMQLATSTAMRGRILELAIAAAPPSGEAMPSEKRDTKPHDGAFETIDAAIAHYEIEIRRAAPTLSPMEVRSAAYKRARESHPRLA